MSIGIALQLYTLREQAKDDFVGMLREVAAAGYEAVEFAGYGGMDAADLRALLGDLGLDAVSSHVGYQRFSQEPDMVIDELQTLGCSYAVVPGLPQEVRNAESIPMLAEQFNAWGEQCRAAGLRFGYHNHAWEFAPLGDSTMFDLIAAGTDPYVVDLQVDVFWALVGGRDPVALVESNVGRVPTLHAKELAKVGEELDTTVGDGVTDWARILPAARAAGTEWLIVEQEDDIANAYRDIRRSLANLRRMTGS
jgi:sugar phosphate isomerase/epimerase